MRDLWSHFEALQRRKLPESTASHCAYTVTGPVRDKMLLSKMNDMKKTPRRHLRLIDVLGGLESTNLSSLFRKLN